MGVLSIDITIGDNTETVVFTEGQSAMRTVAFNEDFSDDFE